MNKEKLPLKVAIVYYDNFAPLDAFGPLQTMNCTFDLKNDETSDKTKPLFENFSVGKNIGSIKIGTGPNVPEIFCSNNFNTLPPVDIVLIPGGMGSRSMVNDQTFIDQLKTLVFKTPMVLSVCTGAALLAKTGFLNDKEATTNKTAWEWVCRQGPKVKWVCPPRWIGHIDKDQQTGYMTSAGVAAGIDMMMAVINELFGHNIVKNTQEAMEYHWEGKPENDYFAFLCKKC